MPFEDLYKNEGDDKRYGLIISVMTILFFPAFIFAQYIFGVGYSVPNPVMISRKSFDVAHSLCTELQKPEKFSFVSKEKISSDSVSSTVVFRYQSDRGYEEIMPTMLVWFNRNGWKIDPENNLFFRRNDQTIIISRNDAVSPNYEIYCSAKDEIISFGVYDISRR